MRYSDRPHRPAAPSATSECLTARHHLHAYVDGELDHSDDAQTIRETVAQHLVQCERCTRLERQLRAMRRALHAIGTRTDDRAGGRMRDEFRARMHTLLTGRAS